LLSSEEDRGEAEAVDNVATLIKLALVIGALPTSRLVTDA